MSSEYRPRQRRRVVRSSPAENIDRSADQPDGRFSNPAEWDGDRRVELDNHDPLADETLSAEDFWREQQPPHHG